MDLFEQPIKMMERTTALWQEMLNSTAWFKRPEVSLTEFWNPWIAGLRSANDLNNSAWKIVIEHGEDLFFRMLKESKLYSQSVESQIRQNWDAIKKAQNSQRETLDGLLVKMESLLTKKEESA
jgi:hypothetical protein